MNPRTAASSILVSQTKRSNPKQVAIVRILLSPKGLLYTHIDQTLNDADWLLARLKSESTANPVEELFGPPSPTVGTQAEKLFSNLCERLMLFVASCSELVQSALPPGPATEGILKVSVCLSVCSLVCIASQTCHGGYLEGVCLSVCQ